MKDLRTAYLAAWDQATKHGGDFQDCLLHYLSKELDMPVVSEPRTGNTDEGTVEMTQGLTASDEGTAASS